MKFKELNKQAHSVVIKDYIKGFEETHPDETMTHPEAKILCEDTNDDVDYEKDGELKENIKSYIYALFDGEKQIDQTSIDEMNENLAWEIMVIEENRNPKGLTISLIDEVQE